MNGPKPKLTADQIRELRAWADYGRSMTAVARRLGVSLTTVRAYLNDERKNHLRSRAA
jgi:DNA-binding CsgD family transcriptional regulator